MHTDINTYNGSCTSEGHDLHEGPGKLVEAVKGVGVGRASKAQAQRHTGPGRDVVLGLAKRCKIFKV